MLCPTTQRAYAIGLVALAAGAAALLGWQSVQVNLGRACAVDDTPYLPLCYESSSQEQRFAALRSRILTNPGDSGAYVQLAMLDRLTSRGEQTNAAAARLAPVDPTVMAMQVTSALERQDWAAAVGPLVDLVAYRNNGQAALMLARLIGAGKGELLAGHLVQETRWFEQVLGQMANARAPWSAALPLVTRALNANALDREAVLTYIGRLKEAGAWIDAYSLWLTLNGRPLPILYNAGFDQPFVTSGFDWEVRLQVPPSRAGAVVERTIAENRGAVLDVRFTGRAIQAPMVKQQLFLGEGRYRLQGDYRGSELRMEQGLAWVVRCTPAAAQAGRSTSLGNTAGTWQHFEFEFSVPPGCGPVASLQLETYAAVDAFTGTRGRIAFDAFSLQKAGP